MRKLWRWFDEVVLWQIDLIRERFVWRFRKYWAALWH